jgi:hypothetical protein
LACKGLWYFEFLNFPEKILLIFACYLYSSYIILTPISSPTKFEQKNHIKPYQSRAYHKKLYHHDFATKNNQTKIPNSTVHFLQHQNVNCLLQKAKNEGQICAQKIPCIHFFVVCKLLKCLFWWCVVVWLRNAFGSGSIFV